MQSNDAIPIHEHSPDDDIQTGHPALSTAETREALEEKIYIYFNALNGRSEFSGYYMYIHNKLCTCIYIYELKAPVLANFSSV